MAGDTLATFRLVIGLSNLATPGFPPEQLTPEDGLGQLSYEDQCQEYRERGLHPCKVDRERVLGESPISTITVHGTFTSRSRQLLN